MKQADEIRARMSVIEADLKTLEELPVEEQTDEHHVRLDALLEDWDKAKVDLAPWEEREGKIAQVRQRAEQQANRVEPIDGQRLGDRRQRCVTDWEPAGFGYGGGHQRRSIFREAVTHL